MAVPDGEQKWGADIPCVGLEPVGG